MPASHAGQARWALAGLTLILAAAQAGCGGGDGSTAARPAPPAGTPAPPAGQRRRPAQRYLRAMAIGPTLANGGIVYYTDATSMRPSTPEIVQWSTARLRSISTSRSTPAPPGWDPATQAAGARGGHLLTGEQRARSSSCGRRSPMLPSNNRC